MEVNPDSFFGPRPLTNGYGCRLRRVRHPRDAEHDGLTLDTIARGKFGAHIVSSNVSRGLGM
jgi:hypothetical protein